DCCSELGPDVPGVEKHVGLGLRETLSMGEVAEQIEARVHSGPEDGFPRVLNHELEGFFVYEVGQSSLIDEHDHFGIFERGRHVQDHRSLNLLSSIPDRMGFEPPVAPKIHPGYAAAMGQCRPRAAPMDAVKRL